MASRRTRGNAAVAIEIVGDDYHDLMEFLEEWWTSELLPLSGKVTESEMSERKQSPTDPGMVWFEAKPDQDFYWECVSAGRVVKCAHYKILGRPWQKKLPLQPLLGQD